MISKASRDNEIFHEDFTTIIKEERNYRKLKESIRMMKWQRSDIERNRLIKDGKRIGVDEIVEILQLRAKFQTAMMSCSRVIWITSSTDHRKVWTANLLGWVTTSYAKDLMFKSSCGN